MSEKAGVTERAKQAETTPSEWAWVDRTIWTERMLAALGNGVKGSWWPVVGQLQNSLSWSFSLKQTPATGEPIPMWEPLTGEPYAGKPHVRFGGRGGREPFSTPIGIAGAPKANRLYAIVITTLIRNCSKTQQFGVGALHRHAG